LLFIVKGDLSEEEYSKTVASYEAMVDGEVQLDEWGKRTLAYPVEKMTEGYYVLMGFETDAKTLNEMEGRMKLDGNVLRHMAVNLAEEKAKSAVS